MVSVVASLLALIHPLAIVADSRRMHATEQSTVLSLWLCVFFKGAKGQVLRRDGKSCYPFLWQKEQPQKQARTTTTETTKTILPYHFYQGYFAWSQRLIPENICLKNIFLS